MERNANHTAIPELSIIIPTRNEHDNLEILLERIEGTISSTIHPIEIIVVDSASTDGTQEHVRLWSQTHPNARLLDEPIVGDLARAWKRGFDAATGRCIACMDADLCHDPAYLITMHKLLQAGADMVVGARFRGFKRHMPHKNPLNELTSRSGQLFTRLYLGMPFTDLSHGFRMFTRELWARVGGFLTTHGNCYMIEFEYVSYRLNFTIEEIPVIYGQRQHGLDKLKLLTELSRYSHYILPLRFRRIKTNAQPV